MTCCMRVTLNELEIWLYKDMIAKVKTFQKLKTSSAYVNRDQASRNFLYEF